MDFIKVALNIAFHYIVVFVARIEERHNDRNSIHGASTFPKPIGVRTEICLKNRV